MDITHFEEETKMDGPDWKTNEKIPNLKPGEQTILLKKINNYLF